MCHCFSAIDDLTTEERTELVEENSVEELEALGVTA